MHKNKLVFILSIIVFLVSSLFIASSCAQQKTAAETVVVTETVVEKVVETVEVEKEHPFTYEKLREMGKAKKYEGEPAKGFSLAFTDFMGGIAYCIAYRNSIEEHWALAGGDPSKLYYADNQYDATIGLKNAEILLAKKPDVFINSQFDAKVNNIIGLKYKEAGIPVISHSVPTPGSTFFGANDFEFAYVGGQHAIELVEKKGGIDTLDAIVLLQMPSGGEVVMLRSEGFYQAFVDKYGADVIDPITIRVDGGAGEAEQANKAMTDIIPKLQDAKFIAMTSVNEQTMSGAIAALQTAGIWDPERWLIISMGADETGQKMIRDGLTDGSVAWFPEIHGSYLIPAACALFHGETLPPQIYIDPVVITKDNIDQYYPE